MGTCPVSDGASQSWTTLGFRGPLNRKKHIGLVERRTGPKSAILSRAGRSDLFRRTNLDAHVPAEPPQVDPVVALRYE